MNQVQQDLAAARKLITNPKRWTQHAFARDRKGGQLPNGHAAKACRWCALGAIQKVTFWDDTRYEQALTALNTVVFGLNRSSIASVNDNTDHATVLALFDKAIAS